MSNSDEKKKITLQSCEGENFEIEEEVAMHMQIKDIVEAKGTNTIIPVPDIPSNIMLELINYCKDHAQDDEKREAFKDKCMELHTDHVAYLATAATHLQVKCLQDLTAQILADRMMFKTVEEVREMFHVENDFTPEEEEEIRKKHPWSHSPPRLAEHIVCSKSRKISKTRKIRRKK